MQRSSQCLPELCSAPVDSTGQASNLFIARLWVSEEMGLWPGERLVFVLGEDAFSEPDGAHLRGVADSGRDLLYSPKGDDPKHFHSASALVNTQAVH